MKRVIVNGDDWGYSPGVSAGIRRAYEQGVLTSTTVLANGRQAVTYGSSKLQKPPLGVGVHLNLTHGAPLVPEAWPYAEFSRPHKHTNQDKAWLGSEWRSYIGSLPADAIMEEFTAQIASVLAANGRVDHIDSHHGVASYWPASRVYEQLARRHRVAARPLSPFSERNVYGGEFVADSFSVSRLRRAGIRTPDRVVMRYFYNAPDPVGALCYELSGVQEGELVEFMVHPAADKSAGDWRIADLEMLTDPRVAESIHDYGIELVTYAAAHCGNYGIAYDS